MALIAISIGVSHSSMATAADKPAADSAALTKAFDSLKTYDYGADRKQLQPIDEAMVAAHDDATLHADLESKLGDALKSGASRDAKDYCCRVLRIVGTAKSVPALAALLSDKDSSHMARYALQSIPAPEAGQALREALPKANGDQKIGIIGSLGARGENDSVEPLAACLTDGDKAIAAAAAQALGKIGTQEAAKSIDEAAKKAPAAARELSPMPRWPARKVF